MILMDILETCLYAYKCGFFMTVVIGSIFGGYALSNEYIRDRGMKDTPYNRLRHSITGACTLGILYIFGPIAYIYPSVDECMHLFVENLRHQRE